MAHIVVFEVWTKVGELIRCDRIFHEDPAKAQIAYDRLKDKTLPKLKGQGFTVKLDMVQNP